TFERLWIQFSNLWTNITHKTGITKNTGFNREQRFCRKQKIRNIPIKDVRWHTIDQKTCRRNCIRPKVFRNFHLKKKSTSYLKKMPIFSFGHAILGWGFHTGRLMKN
ncbi:hypothetical protein P3X46_033820, partial [Hevea brasiliensis]